MRPSKIVKYNKKLKNTLTSPPTTKQNKKPGIKQSPKGPLAVIVRPKLEGRNIILRVLSLEVLISLSVL